MSYKDELKMFNHYRLTLGPCRPASPGRPGSPRSPYENKTKSAIQVYAYSIQFSCIS